MGGAIARALAAVADGYDITVANPTQAKLDAIKASYPLVSTTTDNVEAVVDADVVILAVKPWLLKEVIDQIKPRLVYRRNVIISLAGGVSLDAIDEMLLRGDELPAVSRVIPNTALSLGKSMTFITSRRADKDTLVTIEALFRHMGEVAVVEEPATR